MRRNKNFFKERDVKRQKLRDHSFHQGGVGGGQGGIVVQGGAGGGKGGVDQGGIGDSGVVQGGFDHGGGDSGIVQGGLSQGDGLGQGDGVGQGGARGGRVVQGGLGQGGAGGWRVVQGGLGQGDAGGGRVGQGGFDQGGGLGQGDAGGGRVCQGGLDQGGVGGGLGGRACQGGLDQGGVGDGQGGGVGQGGLDQSGGLGLGDGVVQGDGNQQGTMETKEGEIQIHENQKPANSERQLLLRCTLLEQQNRAIKARENVTKSFLQSTLFRLHCLEHRLSQLEKLQKSGPISSLPEEMIFSIFRHLPLSDIISAQSVCRTWSRSIVAWLKAIDLSPFYNGVNNWTLKKISKFSNLQCLVLSRCKEIDNLGLTVVAESFPGLIRLDLFGCQANDFSVLRGLRELRALRVGDCKAIVDKDLEGLPPQLESLRIEWCPGIRAEGLTNLSKLTHLTSLHVGQCDFLRGWGFSLPGRVAQGLTELTVDRQPFFNDQALGLLRGCTSLRKLHFYWLPIQGTRVRALSSLERLEHLKLQRCHALTDDGLLAISTTLTNLKVLELRGESRVTNKGLQHLANLSFLRVLRLRCGKHVNDAGLQFLSHLSLTKLDLCDCVNITNETLLLIASTQCNTLRKLVFSQYGAISASTVSSFLSRLTNLVEFRLY